MSSLHLCSIFYFLLGDTIYTTFDVFVTYIYIFSMITQVIKEILALSLAENGVIFRYNHLRRGDCSGRTHFQNGHLFVDVSEEEINLMKENAIPRNIKHATKVRCENCAKCN